MWREKFEVNRTTASPTDAHLASLLRRLVRSFLRDEVERRLWLQRIVARPPGLVCVSIVEWDSRGAGTLVRPPAFCVRRVLFCTPSPPHPPPTPPPPYRSLHLGITSGSEGTPWRVRGRTRGCGATIADAHSVAPSLGLPPCAPLASNERLTPLVACWYALTGVVMSSDDGDVSMGSPQDDSVDVGVGEAVKPARSAYQIFQKENFVKVKASMEGAFNFGAVQAELSRQVRVLPLVATFHGALGSLTRGRVFSCSVQGAPSCRGCATGKPGCQGARAV